MIIRGGFSYPGSPRRLFQVVAGLKTGVAVYGWSTMLPGQTRRFPGGNLSGSGTPGSHSATVRSWLSSVRWRPCCVVRAASGGPGGQPLYRGQGIELDERIDIINSPSQDDDETVPTRLSLYSTPPRVKGASARRRADRCYRSPSLHARRGIANPMIVIKYNQAA